MIGHHGNGQIFFGEVSWMFHYVYWLKMIDVFVLVNCLQGTYGSDFYKTVFARKSEWLFNPNRAFLGRNVRPWTRSLRLVSSLKQLIFSKLFLLILFQDLEVELMEVMDDEWNEFVTTLLAKREMIDATACHQALKVCLNNCCPCVKNTL